MNKAQEILKAGKFTVHGIKYDVDHAGTNNDPANNIATGDIQRIHGSCQGGYVNVPPANAYLIEVTPLQEATFDPVTEEQAAAPEPPPTAFDEDGISEVVFDEPEQPAEDHAVEPEPEPTPAPRRVRKH